MWAVVGLGNPGREYALTRHNTGFLFIKQLARAWGVDLRGRRFHSKTAEVRRGDETVLLVMPQTYMNRSGQAVREILSAKKLSADRLLVVTDDFDLPLGGLRIRKEGSPGTHKGMQSISQEIQTRRFPRIRIGIGGCGSGEDSVSYVLSPFEERERPLLRQALSFAQQALDLILQGKIDAAMNRYNRKNPAL